MNLQQLRAALRVTWNDRPQGSINHFFRSMRKRNAECIRLNETVGNNAKFPNRLL